MCFRGNISVTIGILWEEHKTGYAVRSPSDALNIEYLKRDRIFWCFTLSLLYL